MIKAAGRVIHIISGVSESYDDELVIMSLDILVKRTKSPKGVPTIAAPVFRCRKVL